MNKDDKIQTPAGDPQISSTLSKVQQLIKKAEQEEAAAEAARTRCPICFRETSPNRKCGGHSGSGGGGGGTSGKGASSGEKAEEKASQGDKSLAGNSDLTIEAGGAGGGSGLMTDSEGLESQLQSDEKRFNPEIIAQLVADNLLLIDNDREAKTLTIHLECEPDALSEEQRQELKKFLEAILEELKAFKEEHELSDDCANIIQDKKGNILSLCISLPTPTLYNAFIQRLANHLLPLVKPKIQVKDEAIRDQNLAPNPFSMEPKPTNKSSKRDEIERHEELENKESEEEEEIFNPSPFSIKMIPG